MKNLIQRGERGASSVEYGLLLVGITAILVVAVYALGTLNKQQFEHSCNEVGKTVSKTC